ncbi:MAG: P-II family nitrogen regulator [Rhizobiaceae bacterium]|nr:P-II family nitrogen regulator [Rhizobiaceae bacterium]
MKWIMAVIQPHRLEEVREALAYAIHYIPKLKIEIAVSDRLADKAVELIAARGRTGNIGDGKIFVFPLEGATRIRTGETGDDAL